MIDYYNATDGHPEREETPTGMSYQIAQLLTAISEAERTRRERSAEITVLYGQHGPLEMPPLDEDWQKIVAMAERLLTKSEKGVK